MGNLYQSRDYPMSTHAWWSSKSYIKDGVRIPMKPAMHSNLKPATHSETKPASVPI
jgi:hypothetical protein